MFTRAGSADPITSKVVLLIKRKECGEDQSKLLENQKKLGVWSQCLPEKKKRT